MQQIPVHQHDPKQVDGKIYVRLTEGHYQRIRRAISGSLMLMFFLTAWINLDGQQIVLFDFFSRRLHLFGMLLSPKDIYLLAGFMIIGAILLFALASAYSRVWCGFACPQSIWTWVFIRIETITEGRRNNRIKDDKKGWNPGKLTRRIAKHSLWALFATLTSMTFIGYFVPIREIASDIISLNLSLEMFSWILIFALLTYVNAGLVREKYAPICALMPASSPLCLTLIPAPSAMMLTAANPGTKTAAAMKAVTVLTVNSVCTFAPPGLISARACNLTVSPVAPVSMPAMTS